MDGIERVGADALAPSGEASSSGERRARQGPAGAGSLAAAIAAQAAGLCEMLIRGSPLVDPEARGVAIQAMVVRQRALEAGAANAETYAAARDALSERGATGTGRDAKLRARLIASADSLLAVADAGADCARAAAEVARLCDPALRVDAAGAAEMAAATVRTARLLIDVNLALLPGDEHREQATVLVADAEAACRRAYTEAGVE